MNHAGLKRISKPAYATVFALAICFFTAFAPYPLWAHYLALPLPLFFLSFIILYKMIPQNQMYLMHRFIYALLFLTCLATTFEIRLHGNKRFYHPAEWPVIKVQQAGLRMRALLGPHFAGDRMATFASQYAIAAGMPIYPELAASNFLFRLGDNVPQDKQNDLHFVTERNAESMLRDTPPAAILVGFYPESEKNLISFAQRNNYTCYSQALNGLILYVRS
jgi:hypothetical protein